MGIYSAFEKWAITTAQSTEFLNIFSDAKSDLARRAAVAGIASAEADFKRVNEAAAECGIGHHYSLAFKMLSKFAHPTAIRMLVHLIRRGRGVAATFSSRGAVYFFEAPSNH